MSTMLDQVRRRSRQALRKAGVTPSGPVYGRLVDAGRSVPLPPKARVILSTAVLRRPWRTTVPMDRLLVGAQGGWTAREFAERTGDLLWPSTPFLDGPHVRLLELADERGELPDAELLGTPYLKLGQACVAAGGDYFGAVDEAGLLAGARAFIARYRGTPAPRSRRPAQSGAGDPVLVAPVRGSRYYQILDGHHRLAIAARRGATAHPVVVKWIPVTTPLQDHLGAMSWLEGEKYLYQPIDAPEVRDSWPLVRQCTDRLDKMRDLLAARGITPPASYLDVACCYGWFVGRLAREGFDASGIERDPLAGPLGRAVYGLPADAVAIGDAVEFLRGAERTWDVVSCFSLLHHFVLGRGPTGPQELVRLLGQVTGQVLFLDTGQEHEEWFRTSLRGWDTARIAAFLREHGGFDEIIDLGPDDDDQPPFAGNYGRHLFACLRTRPDPDSSPSL